MSQLKLFDPIRTHVQIRQKTIKHTPVDKLYEAFISLMAGAHGLVEINTRLRTDTDLPSFVVLSLPLDQAGTHFAINKGLHFQ